MSRRAVAVRASSRVALAALSIMACEPRDQTPVGRGARVFTRTCSGCHGADGKGVMRVGLAKPPRDLTNPEFQAQFTDEDLRRVIRVGKGQMPAFGGLMGDEDLANVIAFIRTLAPGVRAPEPSAPAAASPPAPAPANALVMPASASPAHGVVP
jgi:mono/diheme cytochrome c family protein